MKKIILAFCLTLWALIVWWIQAFAFTSTSWSGTNFIAGQTGTYTFEFTTSETTFWNPGDGDDWPYIDFNFPEGFEYVGDDLAGDVLISFDGWENYSPITAFGTILIVSVCDDFACAGTATNTNANKRYRYFFIHNYSE
jgi:hypothetical protein